MSVPPDNGKWQWMDFQEARVGLLSKSENQGQLENKSIEIPQKPHNFYYRDDDIALFKNHLNIKS